MVGIMGLTVGSFPHRGIRHFDHARPRQNQDRRSAPPKLPATLSIRQQLADERHQCHREPDQQQRVPDGQNRHRPERPAGNDCGREEVESFRVLSGCDFHTSDGPCVRYLRNPRTLLLQARIYSIAFRCSFFTHFLPLLSAVVPILTAVSAKGTCRVAAEGSNSAG